MSGLAGKCHTPHIVPTIVVAARPDILACRSGNANPRQPVSSVTPDVEEDRSQQRQRERPREDGRVDPLEAAGRCEQVVEARRTERHRKEREEHEPPDPHAPPPSDISAPETVAAHKKNTPVSSKATAATTKAAMSGERGCRIERNTPSQDWGSSATRRPAEIKSVLSPRPVVRMAASSSSAAPLNRKTATTTSSIPNEIAKNHATGRTFVLSLNFCMPTYLLCGVSFALCAVEGTANPG